MPDSLDISPLTLNRLSVYLRCLRALQADNVQTVSSLGMAERFHLSSSQIRKDLAHFGEFGVRGVGYEVDSLADRLHKLLGLDVRHRIVIVGMGNLGTALAGYFGFNDDSFTVVAGVDDAEKRIGKKVGQFEIQPASELSDVVKEAGADIGIITVPSESAEWALEALVASGIRSILNFAPVLLKSSDDIQLRNVDMRIHLEEVSFHL